MRRKVIVRTHLRKGRIVRSHMRKGVRLHFQGYGFGRATKTLAQLRRLISQERGTSIGRDYEAAAIEINALINREVSDSAINDEMDRIVEKYGIYEGPGAMNL